MSSLLVSVSQRLVAAVPLGSRLQKALAPTVEPHVPGAVVPPPPDVLPLSSQYKVAACARPLSASAAAVASAADEMTLETRRARRMTRLMRIDMSTLSRPQRGVLKQE